MRIDSNLSPILMPSSFIDHVDALAAPAEDGGILVWPNDRSLVELAEQNQKLRRRYEFRIGDRLARELMCPADAARLVFMTGHQPEFFHPGVWVKNVAVAHLALSSGYGEARFLVVDSDVPGTLAVEWPDDSEPFCRVGRVAVRSHKDWQSYEQIGEETSHELAMALTVLPERIDPAQATAVGAFRSAFSTANAQNPGRNAEYVARWIRSMQAVDALLGVKSLDCVRISEVMQFGSFNSIENELGRSAWAFVDHLASKAGHFAQAYNAALANYRRRRGIRGTQHPIPDLQFDGDRVELPFWSISPKGPRRRVFAEVRSGAGVNLYAEHERIGDVGVPLPRGDGEFAMIDMRPPLTLRPRALAQTMFMRLFGCDLFIHGIGGAKYDTITDDIIRDFFQVEPPGYACVSATMRLPIRRYGITAEKLAIGTRITRDVRYNPQRFLNSSSDHSDVSELLKRRAKAIELSDHLRAEQSNDRDSRRAVYQEIRRANESLTRLMPDLGDNASRDLADLERQFASDKLAGSREWFFAMYPLDGLQKLVGDVRSAVAGGASVL